MRLNILCLGYSAAQNSDTFHLMPWRVDSGGESAGDDDSELAGDELLVQ
jgi:hypothetical protein